MVVVSLDCSTNEAGSIRAVTYGLLQGTGTVRESEIPLTSQGREAPVFLLWHPLSGTDPSPSSQPSSAPAVCSGVYKSACLPRESCPVGSDRWQKLLMTSNVCPRFA